MYRNLVEVSMSMINNDEYIFYSKKIITNETFQERFKHRGWKLMLSRPVFKEETIPDFGYRGRPYEEEVDDLTRFFDAYFRIKTEIEERLNLFKSPPVQILSHMIAYNYYDCLSGGCPIFMLYIFNKLCQHPNINKNERVYPGNEGSGEGGWNTITDFIRDTQHIEKKYDLKLERILLSRMKEDAVFRLPG